MRGGCEKCEEGMRNIRVQEMKKKKNNLVPSSHFLYSPHILCIPTNF